MSDARVDPNNGLELVGLRVCLGGNRILDDVDLSVGSGEIVAVVGPSGSGKSTLLRAVAGLVDLDEGRITLGGRDLDGVPTHRRGLGLMFQDNALFPHLSVGDNVAYGLKMAGVSPSSRAERVGELLELVGLSNMVDRPVQSLSGGEAQRVALARALAPEPGLLMLDEPLGSLDRSLREELTGELRTLLGQLGQSALHVTHDQGEAFALADRVAVLIDGRLRQVGRPEELWFQPSSVEVARFVGHENLVTVTVGQPDPDGCRILYWADCPVGVLPADKATGIGWPTAVVPASALRVVGEGPIKGRVQSSTFARGIRTVTARVNASTGDEALGASGDLVRFETTDEHHPGEVLALALDVDQIMIFGESGSRIDGR